MSVAGQVKEIAALIRKIGDLDLYARIVSLQESVVRLSDDLIAKTQELQDARATIKKL